mmetsp:Transcript_704/g.1633  ORF Transcript_704/g.1633 Transcript_704/m.1633 type:complete len:223 (-) Transcript_704:385-1053(-)
MVFHHESRVTHLVQLVVEGEADWTILLPVRAGRFDASRSESQAEKLGGATLRHSLVVLQSLHDARSRFLHGLVAHGPNALFTVNVKHVVMSEAVETSQQRPVPCVGVQPCSLEQGLLLSQVQITQSALASKNSGPVERFSFWQGNSQDTVGDDTNLGHHFRLLGRQRIVIQNPSASHNVGLRDAESQCLDDQFVWDRLALLEQLAKIFREGAANRPEVEHIQ